MIRWCTRTDEESTSRIHGSMRPSVEQLHGIVRGNSLTRDRDWKPIFTRMTFAIERSSALGGILECTLCRCYMEVVLDRGLPSNKLNGTCASICHHVLTASLLPNKTLLTTSFHTFRETHVGEKLRGSLQSQSRIVRVERPRYASVL